MFTEFRAATAPLAGFLGGIFGRPGWCSRGPGVRTRATLVQRFRDDGAVPFFMLT